MTEVEFFAMDSPKLNSRAWLLLALVLPLSSLRCDCGVDVEELDGGDQVVADAAADAAFADVELADGTTSDLAAQDGAAGDGAVDGGATDDGAAGDGAVDDRAAGDGAADGGAADDGAADDGAADDGAADDGAADDGAVDDGAVDDGSTADSSTDAGSTTDGSTTSSDAGTPPPGFTEPCVNGQGWTLFRFHYDDSYSARLDVWNPTCDYSLAPGSACNVYPVNTQELVHDGYALLVNFSDYIRVRFNVNGLSFSQAAVYVQARSYATSSSTSIEVWSPLYGSAFGGPVDNDWTFDWYEIEWTGLLFPDDDPDLTAIQIYPYQGSNSLAVHAVELCVW